MKKSWTLSTICSRVKAEKYVVRAHWQEAATATHHTLQNVLKPQLIQPTLLPWLSCNWYPNNPAYSYFRCICSTPFITNSVNSELRFSPTTTLTEAFWQRVQLSLLSAVCLQHINLWWRGVTTVCKILCKPPGEKQEHTVSKGWTRLSQTARVFRTDSRIWIKW